MNKIKRIIPIFLLILMVTWCVLLVVLGFTLNPKPQSTKGYIVSTISFNDEIIVVVQDKNNEYAYCQFDVYEWRDGDGFTPSYFEVKHVVGTTVDVPKTFKKYLIKITILNTKIKIDKPIIGVNYV